MHGLITIHDNHMEFEMGIHKGTDTLGKNPFFDVSRRVFVLTKLGMETFKVEDKRSLTTQNA